MNGTSVQQIINPYVIHPARIVGKIQEAQGIYTYRLQLLNAAVRKAYRFVGGQFNMVYAFGVGEVAMSIVSDPDDRELLDHTIRMVGRVTQAIGRLRTGDMLGIRGPYGRGWPLDRARGKDVLIVTGGLGCAPVVGVIEYIFRRRDSYGAVTILHGVKAPQDLLYRERFDVWRSQPNTEVYLSSDQPTKSWQYHVGVVTELFEQVTVTPGRTIVMMCGPEIMMRVGIPILVRRGISETAIFLTLERHMECGIGLCGHCQMGPYLICKDGPVMRFDTVSEWLGRHGV